MRMLRRRHIGYRTLKTVLASLIALTLCDLIPVMDPVLTVMGIYCAMERTIADSWRGCLNQFFGVVIGSAFGFLLLMAVPEPSGWLVALLLLLVITACNLLRMSYAVFLASIIFVSVALGGSTPESILGRIRDVSIGLATGLAVNLLVHPNSNEHRIHALVRRQQKLLTNAVAEAVLTEHYPDLHAPRAVQKRLCSEVEMLQKQLFLFHRTAHARQCAFESGLFQLAGRMFQEAEVLCTMDTLPPPDPENLARLRARGIETELRPRAAETPEAAVVANYHLTCFLQAVDLLDGLLSETA